MKEILGGYDTELAFDDARSSRIIGTINKSEADFDFAYPIGNPNSKTALVRDLRETHDPPMKVGAIIFATPLTENETKLVNWRIEEVSADGLTAFVVREAKS